MLIVETIVLYPGNKETAQFSKDASELYKRIKNDPEQMQQYQERLDNWSKTASKKQQKRLWETLNKSYNKLNQEVHKQFGAECITIFSGGLLDGQHISVSSGIKRRITNGIIWVITNTDFSS